MPIETFDHIYKYIVFFGTLIIIVGLAIMFWPKKKVPAKNYDSEVDRLLERDEDQLDEHEHAISDDNDKKIVYPISRRRSG